ncbi:MAG: hypothetical protein HS104_29820 [Polyangiaceae bacterium]|nr:hypothetical protein [Polyangiaceae bacterium]MCL4754634.1 hypothetical protein [Myxococcales bacterium]
MGGLEPDQAAATSTDLDHSRSVVRRIYLGEALAAPEGWEHLRTVLRVEVETPRPRVTTSPPVVATQLDSRRTDRD